jgi:RNA polymerase sigma-70 factor (ECF subfamily)
VSAVAVPDDGPDRESFWECYRPYLRYLCPQVGPGLRPRFDESDIVQETLRKAWEKRDQFHGESKSQWLAWLKETLVNTFKDRLAKEKSPKRDPGREAPLNAVLAESSDRMRQLADSTVSPDRRLEKEEQLLLLAQAIDRLPEDQRTAIVLHCLKGLTEEKTAEAMGKTPKAVSGLVRRGRAYLRKALEAPPAGPGS